MEDTFDMLVIVYIKFLACIIYAKKHQYPSSVSYKENIAQNENIMFEECELPKIC